MLSYSTVHQKHLNEFLRALRSVWLTSHVLGLPEVVLPPANQYTGIRCWAALRTELDPGEVLHGLCFQPPTQPEKRIWFFKPPPMTPAHLLAATSHRLITISTGIEDLNDPYGVTVRSTVARRLNAVEIRDTPNGIALSLKLEHDRVWDFFFANHQRPSVECFKGILEQFARTPQEVLPDSSPPHAPI